MTDLLVDVPFLFGLGEIPHNWWFLAAYLSGEMPDFLDNNEICLVSQIVTAQHMTNGYKRRVQSDTTACGFISASLQVPAQQYVASLLEIGTRSEPCSQLQRQTLMIKQIYWWSILGSSDLASTSM